MIADTSAWLELFRGTGSAAHLRLQRALRDNELLLMPDVVYQELLQGARSAAHLVRLQDELDKVPAFEPDMAREISRQAAILFARCRWRGVPVRSPNDCVVAASAIEANVPVLAMDRDFHALASIEPRLHLLP